RLARRILASERILVRGRRFQRRHDPPNNVLSETCPHCTDINEMIIAISAREQRTKLSARGLVPADHNLMSRPRLGLGPTVRAAGLVRRAEFFRNDTLHR